MEIPRVSRPYMPGYGILPATEGSGLLHWSWAAERLTAARNYWVATVWPDGHPHIMPVWAMWDDSTLWFSSSAQSRKVRNLQADPRVSVTTEDASDPVILEGIARIAVEPAILQRVVDLMNAKYRTDYGIGFLDPSRNATVGVRPHRVFSLRAGDFTGSPTRWTFEELPPAGMASSSAPRTSRRASLLAGAAAGLLAAAAGLGVGQFAAGLAGPPSSPVVTVGQAAIDLAPASAKNFAIGTFGTADKPVLLAGELIVIAAAAAAAGLLAARRRPYGLAVVGVFGAAGLAAALTRPDATPVWVIPTLAATFATAFTLRLLSPAHTTAPRGDSTATFTLLPNPADAVSGRRRFLAAGSAAVATAVAGTLAGRLLAERYDVSAARAGLRLPHPAVPASPLPPGTDLGLPGLTPFISQNGGFYRVDTALLLPQVDPASWQLRIHGMVRRELRLSFADLLRLPMTEAYVTLTCVSDPVGGSYAGNAKWLGASLAALIRRAGPLAGADQLMCTSADGFTSGTPLQVVLDGRDALLAVGMNGVPLPVAHGFPARMVMPGLYGYVSATKWVTDIEVTTFARADAYWVTRGWA
ncbi:MAG TPA: molybdopterin-dependent oxidoreductase, partial [Streptosporangiaceae bacterium]|nr:molybdopterin-dependent oxidoreductase [Streptosporangiaceae bacterium]